MKPPIRRFLRTKFHKRTVSKKVLSERFANKGRFKRRREVYFETKRTGARILELQTLSNDVDYIIDVLRRLERRTKVVNLVALELRNLQMQLYYLNNRHNYKTDKQIYYAMGEYFCLDWQKCQQYVLNKSVETEWYLLETEGSKEPI